MKIKKVVATVLLTAGLVSFSTSCSQDPKNSKEEAKEVDDVKFNGNEEEADKLAEAFASNLFEIKISENAEKNAQSQDVKQLAAMLVRMHTKMNDEVAELSIRKGVNLPLEITEDQKQKIADLSLKTGVNYDKDYTIQIKKKHEKAIDFYENIADKCNDPDLKAWGEKCLSEVRSHMDMVMNTENSIKQLK